MSAGLYVAKSLTELAETMDKKATELDFFLKEKAESYTDDTKDYYRKVKADYRAAATKLREIAKVQAATDEG